MAQIAPFYGIRYNQELNSQLSLLLTPPYDVIDPEAQRRYHQLHPYNVIRLELGNTHADDTSSQNRYTRSSASWKQWMAQATLLAESKPALYIYQQHFSWNDSEYCRTGFITRVKLEAYAAGTVLPHEETLPKAKQDRLELLRACHSNFSSIFGLYIDANHQLDGPLITTTRSMPPTCQFSDEDNVQHSLWVIDDPALLNTITALMADHQIFIADGHHRYETALNFSKEIALPGSDYVMMTLVNLYDPGLLVLPTHRLVSGISADQLGSLATNLQEHFVLEEYSVSDPEPLLDALVSNHESKHCFGLRMPDKALLLHLRDSVNLTRQMPAGHSAAWQQLDVAILQHLIMEKHLGIRSQELAEGQQVTYTRDASHAWEAVDEGHQQLAFLLNPTSVTAMTAVASAGDKMPQKSTYFYPKLITGLVMNDLER